MHTGIAKNLPNIGQRSTGMASAGDPTKNCTSYYLMLSRMASPRMFVCLVALRPKSTVMAPKENDTDSFYSFICKTSKVPVMNGSSTHATWPLKEEFCRTMLLMHWPNWRSLTDIKDPNVTWKDRFNQLLQMTACPNFVKSQVDRVYNHLISLNGWN